MSKLPSRAVRLAAAAFVARIVEQEHGGNQTRAARAMAIPQSQLSALLSGSGRGLGLVTLIRVADYARVSLDEVIGRRPPPQEADHPPDSGEISTGNENQGPHRIHEDRG